MEQSTKFKWKIFLWDQFILPIYLLFNLHTFQAFFLALVILSIFTKSTVLFWTSMIVLGLIYIYEMFKYFKRGEYMDNYRKYKSEKGSYKDWRKVVKEFKKEKKEKAEGLGEEYEEVNSGKCNICGKSWIMDNGGNWTEDCNCKEDKEMKEENEQE